MAYTELILFFFLRKRFKAGDNIQQFHGNRILPQVVVLNMQLIQSLSMFFSAFCMEANLLAFSPLKYLHPKRF
jgi:hypothetical protein